MLEIFSSQADYQAFLVGLGFLFLFLICTSLVQIRQSSPVFFWLALFGFFQWVCQWLAMLTPAWGNPILQDFIGTFLILMALSFLGAGGLSIVLPSVGRRLAISILMLILFVPWLFSLLGLSNFFGAVIILAGLGCSILSGVALLIVARGKHAILLSLGALALMGYGLTLPLILPANQFAHIQAIHEIGRPVLDLIPLSALQIGFSFLTTISMWFFYQNEVWCRPARENLAGVEPLVYSSYFILATCVILVIGGVSTGMFGRNLEADMRVELASRVRIMAAALPPESIKQLTGSEADVGKADYEKLKRLLMAIRSASRDCRFIYLFGFQHRDVVFLVDSEPMDSPDCSPPGQIYQEASLTLKSMAEAPRAFVEGPESDRWGTWITAFDVIKDPSSGTVLALLGLDIDAREWQRKIALHKLLPISITLLMIMLLTGFYLSQQKLLDSAQHVAESEERYRSLVEGTPNGVCLFDGEGRCLAINRNGLVMLGAQEREILGKPFQDYWTRDQQPRVTEAFDQVSIGRLATFEGEILPPQGRSRLWHVVLNPIKGKNDSLLGCVGIFADVTEQRQAEGALRTRQAKLDGIFRAAPVGIGLLVNRVFKEVNDQFCLMTGYSREDLLGNSARLLYPSQGEFEMVGREKYRQIAEQGKGTVETRWQHRDGTVIDVMLSSAPLFDADHSQEILFTAMDITERKKLEAARNKIDKMESLGIMAGGIAHDFNNVLMAIRGNISLVSLASTAAEIQERLTDAEQGCGQAMLLAKQLLTFAKGGAPVKKPNDLKLIVQEAARLALSGSKSKTVCSFPDDLWYVDVDCGQMHQVFTNLLINADQAMPSGGQIYLQAENRIIRKTASPSLFPGNYVLVTIIDQGVGIAPEQLDKIFDPYYSTKQKGSGLGLATVYSIVKQHGGLTVSDSKLGGGATFYLYLPALGHSEKVERSKGKGFYAGHGRILVLEDDATVRAVMGRMLAKLGYESIFAQEGQEALVLYTEARRAQQPFDLVILDLTIPGGMGGLETLQNLLAWDPQTKAIVSSGYADDPVLANFQDFGFRGVIAKPYRITELSEVLHTVMV
jgi:PAS domain S-box-containing protein